MSASRTRAHARAAVAILLAASLAAGCSLLPATPFDVIEPAIVPAAGVHGERPVARDVLFEQERVRVSVPVDAAVYAGSVSSPKSAVFLGGRNPGDWVPGYYRAFESEAHQDAFYAAMGDELHAVRRARHLDASRYLEFVTSMVQELTYRTDPVNLAPKFPIETWGDGYGDCDDKTLLAAAILARDGYDVAILLFTPEKHVALGVRAPGLDYKGTGYAYVEMTEPSLVGVPSETLAGGVKLVSQPVVIRIGDGTGAYSAGAQIAFVQQRIAAVRASLKRLGPRLTALESGLSQERAGLQAARGSLGPSPSPAAARAFNAQVAQYNARLADANAQVRRYNALVAVERYWADNQTARPQLYARLRTVVP